MCAVVQIAPSTYYAAKARPPSARSLRDEQLKVEIARVYEEIPREVLPARLTKSSTRPTAKEHAMGSGRMVRVGFATMTRAHARSEAACLNEENAWTTSRLA